MSQIAERGAATRAKIVSPDRTVTATVDGRHGLTVRLEESKLARHSDASLAAQLNAVMRGAGSGMAGRKNGDVAERSREVDPELRERRERLKRLVSSIEVKKESSQSRVRVKLRGSGDIRVLIRPGTIGGRDFAAAELAREINATLQDALRTHAREYMKLRLSLAER